MAIPSLFGRWLGAGALALLAACGGGDDDEPVAESEPIQSYLNCRYERSSGRYVYRCAFVGVCNTSDICAMLPFPDPSCPPGRTTCEACPPGQLTC